MPGELDLKKDDIPTNMPDDFASLYQSDVGGAGSLEPRRKASYSLQRCERGVLVFSIIVRMSTAFDLIIDCGQKRVRSVHLFCDKPWQDVTRR